VGNHVHQGYAGQQRLLGTREDVIAALSGALPGVELERPPTPPKEFLGMMPPAVRDAVTRPRLEADFEHADFSIQFYTTDTPSVNWINAEIRGNGDPLPLLRSICSHTGWSVIDSGGNIVMDARNADASSWESFRQWRDKGIDQIEADEETRQ